MLTKLTEILLAFSHVNLYSLLLSVTKLENTSDLLTGDERNQICSRYTNQKELLGTCCMKHEMSQHR